MYASVTSPSDPIARLLAATRAVAMVHQAHHWQTRGSHYYGDHLLFERLYDGTNADIDALAERAVGAANDPRLVSVLPQIDATHRMAAALSPGGLLSPQAMVAKSLQAERAYLSALRTAYQQLEQSGRMTHGISNLLEGVADKHEGFVYLLQQRMASLSGFGMEKAGGGDEAVPPPPPVPTGVRPLPDRPREMSTGMQLVVGGILLAAVGGIGWLIYKRTMLYHEIAKQEGSTGVLKLTAADVGSQVLLRSMD